MSFTQDKRELYKPIEERFKKEAKPVSEFTEKLIKETLEELASYQNLTISFEDKSGEFYNSSTDVYKKAKNIIDAEGYTSFYFSKGAVGCPNIHFFKN